MSETVYRRPDGSRWRRIQSVGPSAEFFVRIKDGYRVLWKLDQMVEESEWLNLNKKKTLTSKKNKV